MKKLLLILLSVFTLSAYAEDGINASDAQLASAATSTNAFVFSELSHFWWEDDIGMLDYAIIGNSDVPLDAPIDIRYTIIFDNGNVETKTLLTIPAGSTSFNLENLVLGEQLAGGTSASIRDVYYAGYSYAGSMDIIGADNLRN